MNTKKIFKLSSALILATASLFSGSASAREIAVREEIGVIVGGQIGSLGLGGEVAVPINNQATVRASASYLPLLNLNLNSNSYGVANAQVSNFNAMTLIDWHPFGNAFMFSFGGAYNRLTGKFSGTSNIGTLKNSIEYESKVKEVVLAAAEIKPLTEAIEALDEEFTTAGITDKTLSLDASAELKQKLGFVFTIGADNANDPEASFIYGFSAGLMFVTPETSMSSYTLTGLNLNAEQQAKISEKLGDVKDKLSSYITGKGGDILSGMINKLNVKNLVSKASEGTSGASNTSSSTGLFGTNFVALPVITGKIAYPIQ